MTFHVRIKISNTNHTVKTLNICVKNQKKLKKINRETTLIFNFNVLYFLYLFNNFF